MAEAIHPSQSTRVRSGSRPRRAGIHRLPRELRRVLDLGAGTGKVTEGLLPLGLEVTAVEPDDDMRTELAGAFPGATALAGTAERIPRPAASVDAVLVGQAFPWFDLDRALAEIARVLRPGGALGVLWNSEDEHVEWVTGLREASRTASSTCRW